MVFEEVCNTDLSLGSSSFDRTENHLQSHHHQQHKKILLSLKFDRAVPSLTLGFSSEEKQEDPVKIIDVSKIVQGDQSTVLYRQTSSLSVVSLYSNSSVKRERDLSPGEEVDVERGPSKASDEQDEEGSSRKKLRLTNEQSAILEDSFKQQSTLNPNQKQALAKQLNLRPRQVEVWFQNRRARAKLKQIAGDCDLLKKHCETLTDENRRLQKELQELMKERKLNAPFYYMQRPASTLTMCPSCERIGGGENSSKSTFSIGAKTDHFYNTFTHPSAAC